MSIQPPASPADQIAQAKGFLEVIKAQMKAGVLKEAHGFIEGNAGYFVTGDLPDEQQAENFAMWTPYVTFELHRTIPFPKAVEIFVRGVERRSTPP